jgi:hypothetical protein
VTSLFPSAVHSFLQTGGRSVERVDLVILALLGLLLLEYDLLRARFAEGIGSRLGPLGIAIAPLLVGGAIVIGHRWRQLSR